MRNLNRLFRLLGPYRKYLVLTMLFMILETSFEMFIPRLMADLIDIGIASGDVKVMAVRGLMMIFFASLAFAAGFLGARCSAKAAYGWGCQMRRAEFEKIQAFSFNNVDRFETSSLVTRLTGDVKVVQNLIQSGLRPLIKNPYTLVLGIILAFSLDSRLAFIFIVLAPVLTSFLIVIVHYVAPRYRIIQKAVDSVNAAIEENVRSIRTVKAFTRENSQEEKFNAASASLRDESVSTRRIAILNTPLFQASIYCTTILIILLGGNMVIDGEMKIGSLTGFLSYVLQILNSLMMLANVFLILTRTSASAERIIEVLDEEPDIKSPPDGIDAVPDGSIEFENVCFRYRSTARENVLENISFHIDDGMTVGILGGTGSGKTSLVQLIPRLYDVSSGSVRVGGVDVRGYDIDVLRGSIGMVLQNNMLFSGTIRDNLIWGKSDATDEEMMEACRIASVDGFVRSLPDGLDTLLGQGGVNVSGGQKQRLSIARTVLKRPRIMIFDDSMSAVDTATERNIRNSLRSIGDVTRIFISQRISSVIDADMIIVLDDGRIADMGTHASLMERSTIYREIYESQLKGGYHAS